MHSLLGKRGVVLAGLLALVMTAIVPSVASAGPEPAAKGRGFRLFARSLGALTINRIYCGLATTGEICVDSLNSSTIGGGYWPKGTPDQYIFNSGLQIAGVVGPDGGEWANDTTGAFFFDPKGTTAHGEEVQPIYNSANPADLAAWPEAAFVSGELFDPLLQDRPIASQGDIWFMSWDGNPGLNAGRPHPLGVLVETRGMGWNFPSGNEDILYFIYTFYNITTTDASAYAQYSPALQEILLGKANDFQSLNEQAFDIDLPDTGYTITDMYAAFAADNDVADAGANHSSVNLPFALGYTYEHTFGRQEGLGWIFPADIFGAPFFAGAGFIGMKYLKSPTGPGEIQLYSNTVNGGDFGDPRDAAQLYRYLSGNISEAAGDESCNVTDPRVCYINPNEGDTRFFQSSTALELAPGASGTIVIAYIMAAPVAVASYTQGVELQPGDVIATATPADLNNPGEVPMVDSLTGFLGWEDENEDGIAQQAEFEVVPRSLLGKSLTAQAVFDGGFLLPFAPETPEFFLVPGDNEVTVLWRQSNSEVVGDPYFALASQPTVFDEALGAEVPNPLYDPNYRQFDVEGYRVYRGRVDAPGDMELIAQFDYAGTEIVDFYGLINPTPLCAPELGIVAECGDVEAPVPGVAPTVAGEAYPLIGEIVQIGPGGRVGLVDSTALLVVSDTLLGTTGSCGPRSECPALDDTGIPFVFVDTDVRNGFRYFYSVTAFDVNSLTSGPTNLESPRVTKSVTPRPAATNFANEADISVNILGSDGTPVTDEVMPTIDPAAGTFSKRFPPSREGLDLSLAAFAGQVLQGTGGFSARLDSLQLGWADVSPNLYFLTVTTADTVMNVTVPITQSATSGLRRASVGFDAVPIDPALAALYGGGDGFVIPGQADMLLPGAYYTNIWGRGCINHAAGFNYIGPDEDIPGCDYNGTRWFAGDNETLADPTANNRLNNSFPVVEDNFSNAGELPGVVTIYEGRAYHTLPFWWRNLATALGGATRSSDIQFTWGEGGTITSVRDLTYNVDVPFDTAAAGGWGFLNFDDQNVAGIGDLHETHATAMDVFCVTGLKEGPGDNYIETCAAEPFKLSNTAVPGPIAFASGGVAPAPLTTFSVSGGYVNLHPAANAGFVLYVAGRIYTIELEGGALPAAGSVWTMRSYSGAIINGGQGLAGDEGPYSYNQTQPQPFAAVGATVEFAYDVQNEIIDATEADVANVHTVPDPYYVTNAFEQTTDNKIIQFVNLPQRAIIRIYSASGVLVDLIEHESSQQGGAASWDLRNRNNQVVASGVYFFHVESGEARKIGKFTVVNFAQ